MPAGIPKVGKMPDWVKKRLKPGKGGSGREKSGDAGSSGGRKKEFAQAVGEIERTAENIQQYVQELRASPEREMRSLLNALNGGFIAPSPGGMLCVIRIHCRPGVISSVLMPKQHLV